MRQNRKPTFLSQFSPSHSKNMTKNPRYIMIQSIYQSELNTQKQSCSDQFPATHPDILILAHQQLRDREEPAKNTNTHTLFDPFLDFLWKYNVFFKFTDFLKYFKNAWSKNTIYYNVDKEEFFEAAVIHGSEPSKFVDLNYEFSNFQLFNGL